MKKNRPNYWKSWCTSKSSLNNILASKKENDYLLNHLNKYLNKKGKTLEAGCGHGRFVFLMAMHKHNIVGLDFNKELIKKDKEKLKKFKKIKKNANVEFKVGNVLNTPFPDGYFTNYTSFGVVEHFKDKEQKNILDEAYRILRKGGIIFIEVPNKYSIWSPFRFIYSSINPKKYVYQKNISKRQIERLAAGFKKIVSFNERVYDAFKLALCLNEKKVKGIPNIFYYLNPIIINISSVMEKYFPILGYHTFYIGVKE